MRATPRDRRRGAALILALVIILVLTMVVVGTQVVTVQQLKETKSQRNYEHALQMAEAGANAYVNEYANNNFVNSSYSFMPPRNDVSSASPAWPVGLNDFRSLARLHTNTAFANSVIRYPVGQTAQGFVVGHKVNSVDNTTTVISYGFCNGAVRMVQATYNSGVTVPPMPSFVFTINSTSLTGNATVRGPSSSTPLYGTNGRVTMGGNALIDGAIELDGPNANLTKSANARVTGSTTIKADAVTWPTVTQIANAAFPSSTYPPGGLAYLATHNDNGLSSAAISGTTLAMTNNATRTLYGKAGGANYYLTSFSLSGNSVLTLDNSAGPITVWLGPLGGSGPFTMSGNSQSIAVNTTDPTKVIRFYSALDGAVNLSGNALAGGVYAYDSYNGSNIGSVSVTGNASVSGQLLSNSLSVSGNGVLTVRSLYANPVTFFPPTPINGAGIGSLKKWTELK